MIKVHLESIGLYSSTPELNGNNKEQSSYECIWLLLDEPHLDQTSFHLTMASTKKKYPPVTEEARVRLVGGSH